jgi:hypothetical protein
VIFAVGACMADWLGAFVARELGNPLVDGSTGQALFG